MPGPAVWKIRGVQAHEWREIKELRLAALADPVAALAFHTTYDEAVASSDAQWQDQAVATAAGERVKTFVAEDDQGWWVGTVTVLVDSGQLVAVFVRPEQRGTGLAEELIAAALEWVWALETPRLKRVWLQVHERNSRAEGLYLKLGFRRTGVTAPVPSDPQSVDYELELQRPAALDE